MTHTTIPAQELHPGDLMRINKSTNYVIVGQVELLPGEVAITIYCGDELHPEGPTLFYKPSRNVELSMRDCVLVTDPDTERSWWVGGSAPMTSAY